MAVELGDVSEVTGAPALKAAFAEFLAVFLFVFVGVGSVVSYNTIHDYEALDAAGLVLIAVAHGFAIFITVQFAAGISGGHVNPAVTFALAVAGKITILRSLLYWVFQLLGSVAATYLLGALVPHSEHPLPVHHLGFGTTVVGGLIIEIILTFALVFVVFATAVDAKSIIAPLTIGVTVLVAHFLGVPFTGSSLNPARSFGPALVEGDWEGHWVYWVGPLIGALIASVLYNEVYLPAPAPAHASGGYE